MSREKNKTDCISVQSVLSRSTMEMNVTIDSMDIRWEVVIVPQ